MMNTENIGTMDIEQCKKFLIWMDKTPDQKRAQHFESLLASADKSPIDMFMTGLKKMAETLNETEENPVMRIMTSPVGVFQTGLLLGYCMSRASVHPDFAKMLSELESKTKNVTPITAAKGFK